MGQQSIPPPSRRPLLPLCIAAVLLLLSVSLVHPQTPATSLPLILPSAIAYDSQGNLYIAEAGNHVIRKIDLASLITTIAGTGTQGFSGDGGAGTAAQLDSPQGLALSTDGKIYIADTHNNRIRKLDLTTGLITTIAGTTAGFSGDNGPASSARLNLPTALAVDAAGDLYLADTQNYRVRKIAAATGVIMTVAGNGTQGFSGDNGPATAASVDSPTGLAIDAAGDLYIADTHNHRIRKVAASGMITTIAGTGAESFAGDNSAAKVAALALPRGLSIDSAGNLYLADAANHRIRRIDATTGAITTVAGDGTQTFSGDNGPATAAALDSPRATALSPTGRITLADTANQRVRQLDPQFIAAIHTIAGLAPTVDNVLMLTASPAIIYGSGQLTATLTSPTDATGSLTFVLLDPNTAVGTTIGTESLSANTVAFDTSALAVGTYTVIASYAGDSTHTTAQSQPLTFSITPRQLTATPDPITLLYGQPIPTLTGTVSGELPQDDGILTSSFKAGIAPLSPAATYPISASLMGAAAKNYTLTTTPASVTINPAPTLTIVASSAAYIVSGTPITLTAHTVTTTAGTPTGSILFMDGPITLLTSTIPANGSVAFITSTLATGPHTLTTRYAGDKNFIASASAPDLITVIPAPANSADFTLTPTGVSTQTIPSGGTADFNFILQIQGSTLASPITLAATGLPALATASFNPAFLPPGTTPNTVMLTINTPQTAALHRNPRGPSPLLALLLFPITAIALRLQSCRSVGPRLAIAILASGFTLCSGCGSRVNTGGTSTNPVKTYAITVTGTATGPTGSILQHVATVKLLIQSV